MISFDKYEQIYRRQEMSEPKMELITFVGWQINKHWVQGKLPPVDALGKKDRLTLCYITYTKNETPYYLPMNTQAKRQRQFDKYPLYHLKPGAHYLNYSTEVKPRDWVWDYTIPLDENQADEILKYKMDLPREEIDEQRDPHLMALIAAKGYPIGNQIYNLAIELYGPDHILKKYEWQRVYDKYKERQKQIIGKLIDTSNLL